ncbi:MAG: hypothetical protein R3B97_13945 [Dehalococcoidia bacterium]|nr:hypothetical protein [Dehalococcoidia bacterium]MCB9486042.1 hypothetical protein [Thermoflexaceae bacterium]
MQRSTSPIPRKLVETAFRRFWLLLMPVLAVPVLVTVLVSHQTVYRSASVAWVAEISGPGTSTFAGPATVDSTASARQVSVVNDLLTTRSFREAVLSGSGIVAADSTSEELEAARERVGRQLSATATGPNLVTFAAEAPTAEEAQRLAAAFVAEVQARLRSESTREAAVVLSYFETQAAQAKQAVADTGAALAAYAKLNPTVEKNPDAEYQRLSGLLVAQEAVLQRVLQSQNDAQLQAASITASGEALLVVQDEALLPAAPEPVSLTAKAMYPAAGLVAGVFMALALLYFWYRTDHTIRSAADIDDLELLVLGDIPELRPHDIARRFTPLRLVGAFRRDYARQVAASISPVPSDEKAAS